MFDPVFDLSNDMILQRYFDTAERPKLGRSNDLLANELVDIPGEAGSS